MRRSPGILLATLAAAMLPLVGSGCSGSSEPARVATTIVIAPSSATLVSVGATRQFTAIVKDQHSDTLFGASVAWSPGNAAVATVSATGLVTAVANGTAQVTASSGSANQSVTVTVAQAAAQLVRVSGDVQTGTVGQALALPLVVQVNDATAHPIQGVTVTFAAAGTVGSPSAPTGANGQAQTSWTLGTVVGAQSATATVSGTGITGNPATFTATAQAVGQVAGLSGNGQTGLVGYALNVRPAVRVTNMSGSPVVGAGVTFAVASGGGSATGTVAITNSNGVAQVGSWVTGASAGANSLTATVSGAGIAGNPVTFTAAGATRAFDITIQNVGPALSPAAQSAFDAAVAKWQRIIYQDIPDIANLSADSGDCGSWSPAVGPVDVDDVLILVKLDSIDGPGHVLGSAGPCYVRTTSRLTIMGSMRFDTADVATLVAAGQLEQVITHEMGHVLGFGTLWTQTAINCVQNLSASGTVLDTYFSCPRAVAMFDSIGGTSYTGGMKVPVENCGPASPAGCGAGTVNGHWREPVLVNELMTGYITIGVPNPLSRLSAAAMEDIGYVVNYAGSDIFSQTFTLRAAGAAAGTLFLGGDIHAGPLHVVDSGGRLVRVIQPGARR